MNCDRIARWYQFLEYLAFGRALERRRREYLNEVAHARRVLILGDGDGRFTAEFTCKNKAARIDSLDLSRCMLSLAKERVRTYSADTKRVRFQQGDARTAELPGNYDLIVSHFFLDCFATEELPVLVARITQAACPQAQWLLSEFRLPPKGLWRWTAGLLIQIMYRFFRVFTGLKANCLPDYVKSLEEGGFRCVRHKSAWGGFLVSELWQRA